MQLLGRVAAVGVHLDQHRVLAAQPPGEPRQIRRAQAVLGRAVHDVHPVRVGQRQLVGQLAGAVGAAVVDDRTCTSGTRLVHAADDQRQVLPLVVGGDDDQSALTRAFCWPRAAHVRSSLGAVLVGRSCGSLIAGVGRRPATTHEPPIVQYRGDHSPDADGPRAGPGRADPTASPA